MASTTPNFADNDSSTGTLWVALSFPLTFLAALIVCFRLWWSYTRTATIRNSDWCIVGALANALIQLAIGATAILQWGFGHHVQYLIKHYGILYVQKSSMYFYIYQIFYKILVSLTKMSFLYLYLDIFTGHPRFRAICIVTNWSVVAAMIAFTLATIFQCSPIEYNWNKTIQGGHCFSAPPFWYTHAAWNTVFDIFVLILPIPLISSLQMGRNQKAALMGVFALGAFVCITSIMRVVSLDIAAKTATQDITFSTNRAFIWTQTESCVGIICACLPTLKAPISRLRPKLFSSSRFDRYNLEEVHKGTRTWKDGSLGGSSRVKDSDAESQERIVGIKKTVHVQVVRGEDVERGVGMGVRRDEFGERV